MNIVVEPTTTEVIVKAYTTLAVEGVTIEVGDRTARIVEAEVHWRFVDGDWRLGFTQITGPYRKKDGHDSKQFLDEGSRDASQNPWGLVTPPEIVEGALAFAPAWTPEITPSPYPPNPNPHPWSRSNGPRAPKTPAPESAPAGITHVQTVTQVLVEAETVLRPDDLRAQVKARTARIKRADVHWGYSAEAGWVIESVNVWGPVIRKSDGAESIMHVDELTMPASAPGARYWVHTPPELIEAALEHVPDWAPRINDSPYPRTTTLRSSL
ncbi:MULTISPECIES: hypothetical protein [Microbacterium]|uniref:hypothetical protein n=1 Tax=Microbacterium TaxID=33882 RepID=UPI002784261D|nr:MULTISPECIES: hypothetical protein [Microbacterium]MDQ1083429.1 hypothetical protein [Microbacterium sp. SORGH_AS_0344]MDQ1171291.1 hypothetical protein [Microbacterium proteolyticum]